jgi:hypothetical protein
MGGSEKLPENLRAFALTHKEEMLATIQNIYNFCFVRIGKNIVGGIL